MGAEGKETNQSASDIGTQMLCPQSRRAMTLKFQLRILCLDRAVGDVPFDSQNIGYIKLGGGGVEHEQFVQISARWAEQERPSHLIHWGEMSLLDCRQTALEACWGYARPSINMRIGHLVVILWVISFWRSRWIWRKVR